LSVARTLIALIGVCALAWVTLLWLSRRGFGASRPDSRLRLLDRLALGPRRQLYLVQADSRVFLVGAGDAGTPRLIAELDRRDHVERVDSESSTPKVSH
jgi:flagellar biogenesis protein FliO